MRVLVALGGNAVLTRGEPPDADIQEHHVRAAVQALLPVARSHELVLTHGNGPQVGVLAVESATDPSLTRPYPLDVLTAQTQGMIGYWLLQALEEGLPGAAVAALVSRTIVSESDPAFTDPQKFVGPVYGAEEARRIAEQSRWVVKADGPYWRRVVPSPAPVGILEIPLIRTLVDSGVTVVCSGGGGIPVVREPTGRLKGVEAVVDKDATAALLAEQLGAEVLLMLTDVAAVFRDYDTDHQAPIHLTTPPLLRSLRFPGGSMGPKVDAACRFVERTGGIAGIGALAEAEAILKGRAGTLVMPKEGEPLADSVGVSP